MKIASIGIPNGYSGIGVAGVGLRTNPTSCADSAQLAGKVVGEDTPDVEYCSKKKGVPVPGDERVKPLPAVTKTSGLSIVPSRKAPFEKLVEDVEQGELKLTVVTVGGVATPETS